MLPLSSVLEALPASGIRKIFELAVALERRGEKVIRFDVGRPDVPTPPFVVEAATKALQAGFTHYTGNRGIPELLHALAGKLRRDNGADYDPDTEIVVTAGASEAVAAVLLATLEPGSEVLLPGPLWPHYACCARLAGATPVHVPLRLEDQFALDPDLLERHTTPRTRLIVLCNPGNPTGRFYPRQTLEQVLAFARRRGLWVVADEIYEHFVYDDEPARFVSLEGAREQTILINGFSKAFGMTGWRLGYAAGPARVITQVNKAHQYLTVCATSFAQKGAVAACTSPEAGPFLARTVADFRARRDALLAEVRGLQYVHPGGAFYFFVRLPDGAPDGDETALRLLSEAHVATVPGGVFGDDYRRFLRLSYGTSPLHELREGVRRLVAFLGKERMAA